MLQNRQKKGCGNVFVIFLGGCLAFAVAGIGVYWIGHKAYLNMLKDEEKTKREIEKEKDN